MREKIDFYKELLTEEIIRTDFENKKNKSESYIKMTRIEYLKRLLKMLKILEE